MAIHDGLREYALKRYLRVLISSALSDSRFSPITASELSSLQVSISLLTNFQKREDLHDWTVGEHGIWIEFDLGSGKRTATFLPEVAQEQGWTRQETLESLLRKGGHCGTVTREIWASVQLTRYQSLKESMDYDEYSLFNSFTKI